MPAASAGSPPAPPPPQPLTVHPSARPPPPPPPPARGPPRHRTGPPPPTPPLARADRAPLVTIERLGLRRVDTEIGQALDGIERRSRSMPSTLVGDRVSRDGEQPRPDSLRVAHARALRQGALEDGRRHVLGQVRISYAE